MNSVILNSPTLTRGAQAFNEREWVKQGTWPGSFLWFYSILESFSETWTGRVLDPGLAIESYACIDRGEAVHDCFIGAHCFCDVRAVMERSYATQGPAYLVEYAALCERKFTEWIAFSESIHPPEARSNDELASDLRRYFSLMRENGAFMDSIIVLADLLGDLVGKAVEGLLDAQGINHPAALGRFLEKHTAGTRETNIVRSEASLARLAGLVSADPSLSKLFAGTPEHAIRLLPQAAPAFLAELDRHRREFGWLNTYSFSGQPYTMEEIAGFLQDKLDSLQEAPAAAAADSPETDDLTRRITSLPLSGDLSMLLKAIRELTYVNTAKDDAHQIAWRNIQPLIAEIGRRLECGVDDLTYCTPHEIEAALGGSPAPRDLIGRRKAAWTLIKAGDTILSVQGADDVAALRNHLKRVEPRSLNPLRGRAVYPGKVRGAAKVVLTASECEKVRPGDILIATNTNPDFIPAMRRAAAFVTDTGNLICHAVIAAREFSKPCVISTNIATQVYTDGEELEVDGTLGTVTRLAAKSD